MKQSEKYFTVGEFAKLFNISKQTLIYYEKNNIFKPIFVDNKGYRYYSLEQYFIFEIIITLRKLQVPLQKIATYIKHRDIDLLQQIFIAKQQEYDKQIQILARNKHNLQIKIERLEQAKKIHTDKITLENCPAEYLVVNNFIPQSALHKEKIQLVAKHNLPFAASNILNEYLMGYIIEISALLKNDLNNITKIFTKVSHPEEYTNIFIKPAGMYVTISTPQGYHANHTTLFKKIFDFIAKNNLLIIGHAYITPLRNYWSTANPQKYVTQIAIQASYQKETQAMLSYNVKTNS